METNQYEEYTLALVYNEQFEVLKIHKYLSEKKGTETESPRVGDQELPPLRGANEWRLHPRAINLAQQNGKST